LRDGRGLNANLPEGTDTPPAEVATNAINFAVNGKRNKISFAAPQGGSTVTTASPDQEDAGLAHWLKLSGAVLLGLVAIAGLIFALMQVQGWQF
jgi:hypothetical protein